MIEVRCVDCKFASWQRTTAGKINHKQPGRCGAVLPVPTYLCCYEPINVPRGAIWPKYKGQCDAFIPIETTE